MRLRICHKVAAMRPAPGLLPGTRMFKCHEERTDLFCKVCAFLFGRKYGIRRVRDYQARRVTKESPNIVLCTPPDVDKPDVLLAAIASSAHQWWPRPPATLRPRRYRHFTSSLCVDVLSTDGQPRPQRACARALRKTSALSRGPGCRSLSGRS
jgi:hypothetical protein